MRRFLYLLKKIILLSVIAALGWQGYHYMHETSDDRVQARAYLPMIYPVTPAQVRELILSGVRNNRPALLYIFASDCMLCRWNYNDIQFFATKYPRTALNILMLSVDNDPIEPAGLIYKKHGSQVPVLMLNPPGQSSLDGLLGEMERAGGKSFELGNYPYIAVVDKAGHFQKVQFGWDRKNKIAGLVERAMQQGK
jgi:hypothetical protein